VATEALNDLALVLPNEVTDQDFVDLGESQAFNPEVMDGGKAGARRAPLAQAPAPAQPTPVPRAGGPQSLSRTL